MGHYIWRFYRNTVSRAIRTAKHSYTASKLLKANTSRDPSAWYRTVKQLCGIRPKSRNFHITGMDDMSSLDTADAINAPFTSIVSSLPALDRTRLLPASLPARNPAPIVTRGDMWRELSRIKVRSAAGPDHIICLRTKYSDDRHYELLPGF